jgi:hypothetical protein
MIAPKSAQARPGIFMDCFMPATLLAASQRRKPIHNRKSLLIYVPQAIPLCPEFAQ